MDETDAEEVVTVGQRLREAREAKGLTVEDIAAQTRIPTRHLSSLETGDWDKLPAATYSVGFAKNYASAIGLDRDEIGEQLRIEMGEVRPTYAHPEVYEAADPARTMPRGLVLAALGLLAVVVLAFTWLNNRELEEEPIAEAANVAAPAANEVTAAPAPTPAAAGPVVLTATDAVWIQVSDGDATLHQAELAAGQSYTVPANAVAPVLTTGKPEALRVAVGTTQAPPVGEPGRTVSGVSLKPADLLRGGAAVASPPATQPASVPAARPASPPAQAPAVAVPAESNSVAPVTSGQAATQ